MAAARGELSTPPRARAAQLLCSGVHLSERCHSDNWVGAAFIVLDSQERQSNLWRLHLASEDGRNDWTARVRLLL